MFKLAKEVLGIQTRVLQHYFEYFGGGYVKVYVDNEGFIVFETHTFENGAPYILILKILNAKEEAFEIRLVTGGDRQTKRLFTFDKVNGYKEVHKIKADNDPFFWAKQVTKDEWFPTGD